MLQKMFNDAATAKGGSGLMSITATELKNNLGKYLLLSATEDIFITKNGKIVAKLTNPHQDRVEVAKSLFGIILKISIISSLSIILSKLAITMTVIATRLPILHI